MDFTPRLSLPYLLPNQAQKHVTVNEALQRLDVLTGLRVISRAVSTEPTAALEGDTYILPANATGAQWMNFPPNTLATFLDGAWLNIGPSEGMRAWVSDENTILVFDGSKWVAFTNQTADQFGVNTDADTNNKLAVKANSVLFSHDDVTPGSGDMRQAINRADTSKTASLLFQTDYSADAEIGLAGTSDFKVKVSQDGQSFQTGLSVRTSDAKISLPAGFADPLGTLGALGLHHPLGLIDDDSVASVDFGEMIYGATILAISNSLSSGPVAFFFARMATNPSLTTLFSNGASFSNSTIALTGTTGDDGKVNFSATDEGKFYIENRRGYAVAYSLYVFMR